MINDEIKNAFVYTQKRRRREEGSDESRVVSKKEVQKIEIIFPFFLDSLPQCLKLHLLVVCVCARCTDVLCVYTLDDPPDTFTGG